MAVNKKRTKKRTYRKNNKRSKKKNKKIPKRSKNIYRKKSKIVLHKSKKKYNKKTLKRKYKGQYGGSKSQSQDTPAVDLVTVTNAGVLYIDTAETLLKPFNDKQKVTFWKIVINKTFADIASPGNPKKVNMTICGRFSELFNFSKTTESLFRSRDKFPSRMMGGSDRRSDLETYFKGLDEFELPAWSVFDSDIQLVHHKDELDREFKAALQLYNSLNVEDHIIRLFSNLACVKDGKIDMDELYGGRYVTTMADLMKLYSSRISEITATLGKHFPLQEQEASQYLGSIQQLLRGVINPLLFSLIMSRTNKYIKAEPNP